LNWRKNYFSQLLNVHRVSDVTQIEIQTAEPLVRDPSPFEVETGTANIMRRYKSPGSDKIPAEPIQSEGETLRFEIRNSVLRILGIRKIKLTAVIIVGYQCYELHTKFYPISFSLD
jgi:hypothetical protein